MIGPQTPLVFGARSKCKRGLLQAWSLRQLSRNLKGKGEPPQKLNANVGAWNPYPRAGGPYKQGNRGQGSVQLIQLVSVKIFTK